MLPTAQRKGLCDFSPASFRIADAAIEPMASPMNTVEDSFAVCCSIAPVILPRAARLVLSYIAPLDVGLAVL